MAMDRTSQRPRSDILFPPQQHLVVLRTTLLDVLPIWSAPHGSQPPYRVLLSQGFGHGA